MATKEKTPNFTDEQANSLKAAYVAALESGKDYDAIRTEVVDAFALKFGKGAKSIVAKLSRMGVYKAKEYKTKTGETPVKKDDRATFIGAVLRLSEADTDSLAKANKRALEAIATALAQSKPIDGTDEATVE